jgi:hypothetical protein
MIILGYTTVKMSRQRYKIWSYKTKCYKDIQEINDKLIMVEIIILDQKDKLQNID